MKLEFLDDISDGGRFPQVASNQLVRLYDFDAAQAKLLKKEIQQTVLEEKQELNFATLNFILPINCNLVLNISNTNEGITFLSKSNFQCNLTFEKFQEMVFLMEPFCDKETNGYQRLYNIDTPIDFLFSPGGSW